ncbi:hypothetical protein RhiirC2_712150 [Rhizophagus irregularis]|uniref:Ion transport domain-containing protein n=1 Tax=Rhizophagus irregularis TaxID=588596 RepID=A0A2N1N857_9GLOM|nr:hypothetical protein RhiirC2_712150 [Rhizophagus irregularis]
MDLEKIEPPKDTRLSITDDTKKQTDIEDSNEKNKEKHRKSIDRIFVSQYINDTDNEEYDAYVVTYSKENNSVLGCDHLSYLELKCPYSLTEYAVSPPQQAIGFLPNGDLIQVTMKDLKICKFSFKHKPKITASWEYSQIYDIEILDPYDYKGCFICQTKLFLLGFRDSKTVVLQFNLLTMTLDIQHNIDSQPTFDLEDIAMNKNKTLWATVVSEYIHIISMKSGMISKYTMESADPVEFITLKNGLEGLIIKCSGSKYKFIDPYQPSIVIDITDDIGNIDGLNVITKLNKKISIDNNNNVCVTDWLNENKLQQISHDNSIYTFSSFKIIQKMLKDIIEKGIDRVIPEGEGGVRIEHEVNEKVLFLERYKRGDRIKVYHDNSTSYFNTRSYILSFKLLNNRNLVLIDESEIKIYNIEDMSCQYIWSNNEWNDIIRKKIKNILEHKDDNNENDNKLINDHFKKILDNEFNDHQSSIPLTSFYDDDNLKDHVITNDTVALSNFGLEIFKKLDDYLTEIINDIMKDTELTSNDKSTLKKKMNEIKTTFFQKMAINIINDRELLTKFGSEILKTAIKENYYDVVQQFIDKIIESITSNSGDYKNTLLHFISLNLPELCQNCYSDFLIKYMAYTSIMLSPTCNSIGSSRNTSLNSYLNNCIRKSHLGSNYFKSISSLYDRYLNKSQEETRTIILIVPFPQIFCEYQDDTENNDTTILKKMITGLKKIMMVPKKDDNSWNEFLYKPKEILFCNIDSNNLYNWWNFAAIIDFKWKTFGWIYYSLIWFFYSIFYICFTLASTALSIADFYRGLLYIITIIFGIIQLSFEIRQCLWRPNKFFTDLWNLFAVYKMLTGDSGSLSSWTFRENPTMTFLLVIFTFFTVIYLMNLFIGLLNNAISDYNKEEEFLLQKAQIIMEIELFYMLPNQKRDNKDWFPDWIYYDMPVSEVRKLINAIDNGRADFNYPPFISKELRSLVAINDKYREEKLNETKNELINELKKHIQELLEDNAKKDKANTNDKVVEKKENDDQQN